jgi:Na+/H+-dicarboxylate symporter
MLLAFGRASSESAYPKLLQQLERFGCDKKVCGLVLPLNYSFNLDGSIMYTRFWIWDEVLPKCLVTALLLRWSTVG